METFLLEAAKQVPALGVLCFLVVLFLKAFRAWQGHVERLADRMEQSIAHLSKSYETTSHECHDVQKQATKAITESTIVLNDLKEIIEREGHRRRP